MDSTTDHEMPGARQSRALASPASGRSLRALAAGAARWWQQRATAAALMRCNDRVLADIGIGREDISMIARGLERSPEPSRPVLGRWAAMLAHVEVLAMIRRGAGHGWLGRHPTAVADRA
jgi:uncharacterized protein YjiS (DUF1127 family)